MIEHIVLFRCTESCTDQARIDFVRAARSMKSAIPELLYISSGINWSDRSDGYELALVCRFASKETLEIYQKHPAHQRFIADSVKPNITKVLAVDYFID